MSLQVWLPLNGNLNNQGLNGSLNISAINTLTFVNGKIGQCYQRATNDTQVTTGINIDSNLLDILGTQASIAVWVKPLGTHTHYNGTLLSSGNWNAKRWAFGVSQDNTKVDVLCGEYNTYINCSVPVNEWTHLCSTFDNGISKLYKNGIYIGELTNRANFNSDATNTCIGRETYASGYFGFNGLINDMRIYDHVLSPKEVEEISKGLVLHYKLDNNGLGGNNLALHTHDLDIASSKNNLNMYIRGASTRQLRSDGFYESKGTASWQGLSFWANQLNLVPGTKVTYSFYIYGNGSSRAFSFYPMMYNSAGTRDTSTGMPISIDGGAYTTVNAKAFANTTATTPEYHYVTFEWNQAVADIINNGGSIELSIQLHGTWNTGDWNCIFAPKIEIGDIPTPWSPSPMDLGLDQNIVYDSSGYNRNGEIINTLSTNNNTPRYKSCMHISATNQKIHISNLITSGFGNSYSFAWWGKRNSNSPMFWGFSDGIRLNGMYLGNLWNTGDGSSNPLYQIGTTTQVTGPSVNVWHHYVMTGNGSKCYVYLDGELWAEAKTYKAISGTSIYINGWDSGTSYCSDNTDISDFRIYATALTEEQVLELYHTSATIDNKGNIYSRELVEI